MQAQKKLNPSLTLSEDQQTISVQWNPAEEGDKISCHKRFDVGNVYYGGVKGGGGGEQYSLSKVVPQRKVIRKTLSCNLKDHKIQRVTHTSLGQDRFVPPSASEARLSVQRPTRYYVNDTNHPLKRAYTQQHHRYNTSS